MRLILVHHADAVGATVDSQRPLSSLGLAQAERLAGELKEAGFVPTAIWHSGKLRARQTAEAFLRACNPFSEFKMVRGLRPDDPPEILRDVVRGEERDVLAVGHMPHLAALLQLLLPGAAAFPLHGLVTLETRDGGLGWTEVWRTGSQR